MSKQLSSAILARVLLCNTGVVSGARAKPRRRGRRTAAPCIRHARSTHEAAGELVRMQVRTRQHTSSHLLDPPSRARARTRMHTCSYARSIMPNPVTVTVGRKIGASTAIAQKLVYCGSEEGKVLAMRQLVAGEGCIVCLLRQPAGTRCTSCTHACGRPHL